jgi:hypothetical protein
VRISPAALNFVFGSLGISLSAPGAAIPPLPCILGTQEQTSQVKLMAESTLPKYHVKLLLDGRAWSV